MDEIRKCTAELSRALRESEAYTAFREARTRVKEKPGLKQKIDEFRKKDYLFTELQMCRIIQRCANEILTSVDLEIENFADVIEI